ncbi:MAG: hypothetical protein ACFFD8_10070 [Candidatus Thorarchaeota archaeon]
MPSITEGFAPNLSTQHVLACLTSHIQSQLQSGSFVTLIHAGNSDYLRLLHFLISELLLRKQQVHIFDYHRKIKLVFLRHLLEQKNTGASKSTKFLHLTVILDEDHALNALMRLQRKTLPKRKTPVLFIVDPSGLFNRMRGGVKQSAQALQLQYEAAQMFAQRGYAVIVSDFGGRQFHRIESLVPAQLATPATLVLQFLPRRILLS